MRLLRDESLDRLVTCGACQRVFRAPDFFVEIVACPHCFQAVQLPPPPPLFASTFAVVTHRDVTVQGSTISLTAIGRVELFQRAEQREWGLILAIGFVSFFTGLAAVCMGHDNDRIWVLNVTAYVLAFAAIACWFAMAWLAFHTPQLWWVLTIHHRGGKPIELVGPVQGPLSDLASAIQRAIGRFAQAS